MSTSTASGGGGQPGARNDGYEPDPHRWRALWVTLVAGFMSLLDVTIVAVALPTVQRELHASPAQVQWVVSGYALSFALALVTAGRLGDALDRRRIFLLALSGFVLFSAACGAAPSITLLVVARLAQGLAAGFMAPQNSALIQQMFRGAERGRAFGFFGATVGVSSAVGPWPAAPSWPSPRAPRAGGGSSTSTSRSASSPCCSAAACCPARSARDGDTWTCPASSCWASACSP